MKTFDEIIDKVWAKNISVHGKFTDRWKAQMKKSMRIAAEQAIDRCAEMARTRTNDESTSIIVDKESILKVKQELK